MKGWQSGGVVVACLLYGVGIAGAAELRAEMRQATPTGPGETLGT